ncbi:surface lipoprotein assembly modifier [Thalassovita aquimarina]|uniref:DUF560 domain-containing protein n=1 Tax=Thalassovita aquimarina TaxID=2785917 RepID=A0ABS5HWV6_9RHOB|nr:surface lipoprotein assembly modifier [Thalassovita aquimarina]MBR9653475.1 DUF560 domain-containing protein [Thalassovita aquimarina]
MIRSAPASNTGFKAFLLALMLLLPGVPGAAQQADKVRVPIAAAAGIAERALREGQPELALQLAGGLLQRDPGDAYAHFIAARALMQLKRPRAGRRAAALAYRHAGTDDEKFQAAQLAAKLALEGEQAALAQIWLRRSLLHLPDESYRDRVIADYKVLRRISPWSVSAQFSLAPSNNLNNGAEGVENLINDIYLSDLSGDAQALSGLRATANLSFSRRLSASKSHETRLTGQYYAQRVRLSEEARAIAIDSENADFAYDHLELGLTHTTRAKNGSLTLEAGIGRSWYGQSPLNWSMQAGVKRGFKLSEKAGLLLSAQVQHRRYDDTLLHPVNTLDIRAEYVSKLASGNRVRLGLALNGAQSDTANSRQSRATGYLGYHLAEPVGPAKISFQAGASLQRFPDYSVGLSPVLGGRKDRMVFGSVDFSFHRLDYAGFAPTLTVQARKTQSNFSRFDTNEVSMSFGIRSSF